MDLSTLTKWADRIIRIGFYLLFILVPLALTAINYELFEYNKMLVVYGLTAIITSAWIIKMIARGEVKIARTPLDIPIALFVLSQLVSTLFSIDPHVSWWGYYSRFNGGMWSVISYVLLYYALVSNWAEDVGKNPLVKVVLTTGTIVALYGLAERLGIDKNLWVQDVQNRVFSTLGQPNWLAAYLSALVPLGLGLGLRTQNPELKSERKGNGFYWSLGSVFWVLISVLFFAVILFTRSRSGLLGFAVADGLFWLILFLKGVRSKVFYFSLYTFHFALFLVIFLNGTHVDSIDKWLTLDAWKDRILPTSNVQRPTSNVATPSGTLLEYGGTESGTIRKYVWQGAVNAWQSSLKTKLVGTGTETFAFAFYQFKPKEHNLTSEWDFLYNKAHNEYLNYLATTGALGLGTYLIFLGAFIFWFLRVNGSWLMVHSKKDSAINGELLTIHIALFAGWLSILVTNFFGFAVVVTNLFLFLFPALAISLTEKGVNSLTIPIKIPWKNFSLGFVGALGLGILFILGRDWYADTLYARGYQLGRAGQYAAANQLLSQAISRHPTEPTYHDEWSSDLAGLALAAAEGKEASVAAQFAKKSLTESDSAIGTSPRNVNFWKTRTKVYYALSSLDPTYNQSAIDALEKAFTLSPTDPKITYNLAILYGRASQNDKAIELLRQTIDLKTNYRDAYWALYLFYTEVKKPDLARQTLQDYLSKVDAGDKEFLSKVRQ